MLELLVPLELLESPLPLPTMKVLLVNTSDHAGGAAIAALRLLKALRQNDIEATLLCRDRSLPESRADVVSLKSSVRLKVKFVLERAEIYAANGFSRKGLFAVDTARYGTDITRLPEFQEADVIHLHWVNQAMLSMKGIRRILQSGKRVVWTMHDMWPFTSICHHAADCEKWLTECHDCPCLLRPSAHDFSYRTFREKQRVYGLSEQPTFVGCSQWLTELAQQSPLLKGHRVVSIPNPIDTAFYAPPADKAAMRQALHLPADKHLLLFTAFKVTNPDKGIAYLKESLDLLCKERPELAERLALVVAGQEAEVAREQMPIPTYAFGYDTSEDRQRSLYQASDLLLMPTLMDNLPNTIVEAMACGIPCVGFRIGGLPQMIETGVNGYLAQYRSSADFARGIASVITSPSYTALCRNARTKAVAAYSEKAVAEAYNSIYKY